MAVDELREILRRAHLQPDETAQDLDVRKRISEILLEPIDKRVGELSGPSPLATTPRSTPKTGPQYIAERRYATPPHDSLIRNLKFALARGDNGPATCNLGITICQSWADTTKNSRPIHPAHIRWGLWTHASARVANGIAGPFNSIANLLEWPKERKLEHRLVPNKPQFTLALLGQELGEAALDDLTIDDLVDRVAADICALAEAMQAKS